MNNVISLADKTSDGTKWTPVDALRDMIKDIESGERHATKVLILRLDDTDEYDVGFTQAGMSMSQCLALLEVAKQVVLEQMGH